MLYRHAGIAHWQRYVYLFVVGARWGEKASRGFEPRSLDSESRVLTVTPRGPLMHIDSWQITRQLDGAVVPFDHEGAAPGVSTFPQPPAPFERKAADPNTQPMQGGS